MGTKKKIDISYFPGCSLATTARENNASLIAVCKETGLNLVELDDWNCCGSSSAHSLFPDIALHLASRNLSLAPPGRPLLVACPSCNLRLRHAHLHLQQDATARDEYKSLWSRDFDPDLKIIHFFELFTDGKLSKHARGKEDLLNGLRFVPYYGCMLTRPPALRREKNYYGLMEEVLSSIGGVPVKWALGSRCCGTFLSAAKPAIVTQMVNEIVQNAIDSGAECIVTACSMCHLNVEMRCNLKKRVPVFHFSELLSLSPDSVRHKDWFSRHLVDPIPLLKTRGLFR
jgi:heterodisulfide reductase subunit B